MNMKAYQWMTATAVAAVIGLFYIHGFIFPRTEASALIKRVDRLENVHRDIFKELRDLNKYLRNR